MIKLALGVSTGRVGRLNWPDGAVRAPVLAARPTLAGSGRIGAPVTLGPGTWLGTPAPDLAFEWRRDGTLIPGATTSDYVPTAADDRAALICRVRAHNVAGSATAETDPLSISYPSPVADLPIPDAIYTQDSGVQTLNVASNFQGSSLTFSVVGEGVSIDPETGELSIATETLRDGVTVTVTAKNSGGTADQSFTLTIAAEPTVAEAIAPTLVTPPELEGSGRIGEDVAVTPGEWAGTPAPEIALQWICGDKEIVGATGSSYMPGPEDDGHALTCRVTASNSAGALSVEPAPVMVTREAPVVIDLLPDVTADQGAAPVTLEAAAAFAGEGLRFAVAGAGATIDAGTGVVSIPTDLPLAGETVTVTASNSGGSADASFLVTIEAVQGTGFPPPLPAGAWSVAEVRDAAPEGRRVISIDAAVAVPEGFELRWYSGREPGGIIADYNRVMTPGETYTTKGTLPVGVTCHNVLYWRRVADDIWEPAADEIVFEILGRAADDPVPVAPAVIVAPTLAGTGEIGREVSVDAGSWSGVPAPDLAVQWLRDGAEIDEARTALYVPGPEDDLTALTCRVTASNLVDTVSVETAALSVTYAAPQVVGELYDEVFDEGTGPESVATAQVFAGEGLSFAVAGAGATIDAATGVVSIPTDLPLSGETVTVTASNSGGSVDASFLVTIEAVQGADFPPLLPTGAWSVAEVRDAAPEGRRVISIDAAVVVAEGFELRWYSGREPGGIIADYNRVMTPGETYTTKGTLAVGATCHNMLYWRRVEDDAWEPAADEIAFEIAGLKDADGGGQDAPSGDPAATENRSSVSQNGVTFNFSEARPTGQYPDGSWWVKSPVTVTSITPNSQVVDGLTTGGAVDPGARTINGAMIDWGRNTPQTPQGNTNRPAQQGYDSQPQIPSNGKINVSNTLNFNGSNNVDPALKGNLVFGSGAAATVSKVISKVPYALGDRSVVTDLVVLTVVDEVPIENGFRPGTTSTLKSSLWLTSSLDMSVFPDLPLPSGSFPGFSAIQNQQARVHMHMHCDGTKATMYAPGNQPAGGGFRYAGDSADAALALCTNALTSTQKRKLAEMMVQQGIDVYERANQWPNDGEFGGCWQADGQLNAGRKVYLVLAALLLNDSSMLDIADGRNTKNWRTGVKPIKNGVPSGVQNHYNRNGGITFSWNNSKFISKFDGVDYQRGPIFMEDSQTFYVNQWHIDVNMVGDSRDNVTQYSQRDLGKPEWGINATYNPRGSNKSLFNTYRHNQREFQIGLCTAMWLTQGAFAAWNWPPLFDYVDYQLDWHRNVITQGNRVTSQGWHIAMYDAYRNQAPQPVWPKA